MFSSNPTSYLQFHTRRRLSVTAMAPPKAKPDGKAKKVIGMIKLALEAGKAKDYNARTADKPGYVIPVEITVYDDKSFTFILKTPPGSVLLLKAAGELFANTAGGDFTPHVVNVSTGEDVASIIFSISHMGRGVCVLSANGAVSNVTIRQPGFSGGIFTYEGRFELLSLSGSFTVTEIGGVEGRIGGLIVSLAGPDGRVIGGGIAGVLTAGSPIQIVVGSYMPNGYKAHKIRKHCREHTIGSAILSAPNTVTAATATSQAQPETETRLNSTSPSPAQSHGGDADESMIQMHNTNVMSTNAGWNGTSVPGVSVTGA